MGKDLTPRRRDRHGQGAVLSRHAAETAKVKGRYLTPCCQDRHGQWAGGSRHAAETAKNRTIRLQVKPQGGEIVAPLHSPIILALLASQREIPRASVRPGVRALCVLA